MYLVVNFNLFFKKEKNKPRVVDFLKTWAAPKKRKYFMYLVVNFNLFLKKEKIDQDLHSKVFFEGFNCLNLKVLLF